MNKKAAIVLLTASLAFILASAILLNTQLKSTNFLGDSQLAILGLEKEGKIYMTYIETAAKFSLAETMKVYPSQSQKDFYTLCKANDKLCDKVSEHFKPLFQKHITSFNKAYQQSIDLDNYKFSSRRINLSNKPLIEIIGVSTDEVLIRGETGVYKIKPNFKIQVSLEDLNDLATTPETIAVSFFNELVNNLQECWEIKKDKKNCFCGEINPNELPEGYTISIITTIEREKILLGGVEYQFKLKDKDGNIVVRKRNKQLRKLKGIFGAYEFFNYEDKNNLCYPGAFSKTREYVIDKTFEKGKLYLYYGPSRCSKVGEFFMVKFVKDSELKDFVNRPICSEIGVLQN